VSEWKEYRFSEFVEIAPQVKLEDNSKYSFIEMADLSENAKYCVPRSVRIFNGSGTRFEEKDTLFARITPCLENGKICQARGLLNKKGFGSTEFHVFRGKAGISDTDFIFYLSRWSEVRDYAEANLHGTSGRQRVPKEAFDSLVLDLPPLPEQRAIAGVLSSLDDKIDLLHRQNKTLESLAETLWRETFLEDSHTEWAEKGLDEIADFLNGLPCQKYPPRLDGATLPVVKIKELHNGITDASDLVTNQVPNEYIIDDGDVIFSWSGSLEVIVWFSGKGVLNQHLFKVTSEKYPKWFYFYWIWHHLSDFQDIAQDKATTMGHIQRHHLSKARVLIPDENSFKQLDACIGPIFDKKINNLKECRKLEEMRDALLPKLMTGEVEI